MQYTTKTDLTKNAMADSLKFLMSKKPLNKISVREVAERCGFNRQTFYYHFKDIYDLLEWIINQEILSTMKNRDNFLTWQDAGIYFLKYIQSNKILTLCILNSLGRASIKRFIYDDAFTFCTSYLNEKAKNIDISTEDFGYVVHFYVISFAALLEDWVVTGMKKSPEEVIQILDKIVSGTGESALLRFASKK